MPFEVIECPPARLGECPVWCDQTGLLWWVDVLAPKLWSYDPTTKICEDHPVAARRIGSLALRARGGLILACDDGLHAYDIATGRQQFLVDPEPGVTGHRKNDGRTDWDGNFWVGTLKEADYAPVGAIYRIAADLSSCRVKGDLAIPNGLAFDPSRRRIYYADTRAYVIWFREFGADGQMGEEKVFARTNAPARPDGSCIDAEGFLWNAEYAGGRLVRFDPDGTIDRVIALPFSHPTCCCFGGEDFGTLFVTSALEPLSHEKREREPLAGRLIAMRPGVIGRAEFRTAF